MKIITIPLRIPWAANCRAVVSEQNNAALIDAPCDAEMILAHLKNEGVRLKKILLTHGHFDHIMATAELVEQTGAEVYIHKNDADKLRSADLSVASYFGIGGFKPFSGEKRVSDGDVITLDELEFKVLHTPGHTSGGVCYIVENVIFSGDTLFEMSVGRTDMPDGDSRALCESLKKLSELDGEYKIYPGHGPVTELSYEKKYNPYLQ